MSKTTSAPSKTDRTQNRYHHGNLRETLLQAAEAELEEKGIEGLSLRSIAKRAGVSHAAPAHHFGDVNGLLTALAAAGFERFVAMQKRRQAGASDTPKDQLGGLGLGYIDFAMAHPALFRLIFSSKRPDFDDPDLCQAADAAFDLLVQNVGRVRDVDPYKDEAAMLDVMASWAISHGLADLLNAGRLKSVLALPDRQRDEIALAIIGRALQSG